MTDRECQTEIRRIKKYVNKWFKPMGLGWYDIEMTYSRDYHPEKGGVAGITICAWEYRHGTITWYLPVLSDMNEEELERTVVHELCHILAWPLWDLTEEDTRKQGELAIESIARAFLWCENNDKLKK